MKFTKIIKSNQYLIKKRASEIKWEDIVKGIDPDGLVYKLMLNKNGTINVKYGNELDNDFTPEQVIALVDIYDKNGKLINKAME